MLYADLIALELARLFKELSMFAQALSRPVAPLSRVLVEHTKQQKKHRALQMARVFSKFADGFQRRPSADGV